MALGGENQGYKGSVLPNVTVSTIQVEMEAFDRLGPLTREALNKIALRFSAARLVEWCDARGRDPRHLDAQLAKTVYRDEKIGIDSDPQCA